jgi:putative transposase
VAVARPLRIEVAGGVYHVIARGNERKAIFRDDQDREAYLERLRECRSRLTFRVLAYCLMDNHVHLALERGPHPLSRIILTLHSFYAQKFNVRHRRVGHLFQGRYKSFLVQEERYLLALLRYIHLNPVTAGLVARPEFFRWSSDSHYRTGAGPGWLDMDGVLALLAPERLRAMSAYRRLMASREEQTYEDVPAYGRAVKGDRVFAESALAAVGERRRMPGRWTPEALADAVARSEGLSLRQLARAGKSPRESRVRLMAAFLGRREGGFSIAAMARCLGREESTFNRGVRRLERVMTRDSSLRARVAAISASLRSANTGIHD